MSGRTSTELRWPTPPEFPCRSGRACQATAVFLGASYWSAVGLEVGAARAARWSGARIAIPAVFVFTTVTLAVTLVHLDRFHLGADLPLTTRAVTWAWLAVYGVVPVLMVAATVAQRRESTAVPAPGLGMMVPDSQDRRGRRGGQARHVCTPVVAG